MATGATVNAVCQWSERQANPEAEFSLGSLLLCSLAGGAAASLPDLLEPAYCPHHRQFFHSLTAAALVAYGISGGHVLRFGPVGRMVLWVIGFSYLSHIVADLSTPMSIPLIGLSSL